MNRVPPQATAPPAATIAYDIAPEPSELFATGAAILVGTSLFIAQAYALAEWLIPLMLGAIAAFGIWQLIKRQAVALWTPLFSFRFAVLTFVGIGGLVPTFAGEATRDYIFELYAYSDVEGAKVNLVSLAGYFCVLLTVKLASLVKPGIKPMPRFQFSETGTIRIGLLFAALGLGYSIFIGIPTVISGTVVLPGSVVLLIGGIGAIGLFMTTLWATERGGFAYLLPLGGLFVQFLISLVLMEKSTFIMALLLVGLAMLLRKFTIFRGILLALALAGTLAELSPAIDYARVTHLRYYPDLTGGSIAERLNYQLQYLGGDRVRGLAGEEHSVFVRLHYTSTSAFVMTQYDVGAPSDTISNGIYALIPRIIWPDKPLTSAIGQDINRLIIGNENNALGILIFADTYWNFGWSGLVLFIPVGLFLWWSSCVACLVVEKRDWLMMPFVAVVFRVGLAVDNAFVVAWLTPAMIALSLYLILRVGLTLILPHVGHGAGDVVSRASVRG